ncbi:MFS transporter [Polycladidibacter stylochi]|uniref:MFS transporter n=1 Tax=Polycladidibacter stylochi TaxID=1807766 RepID=UPI00082DA9D9|nr:MFS transporter [Pseudovibrio stylochi]
MNRHQVQHNKLNETQLPDHSEYRGKGRAWLNWSLGVAFVVVVFIMQSGYAITNKSMAADLSLTITQVGLVGSVYTWVFALAQLGSGSMLDLFGAKRCLPFAAICLTLGILVFSQAQGFELLIIGQVLMALGASFGFIGAGFIGGQWFNPAKYGLMFSLVQFAASIGALIGQRVISYLIIDLSITWSSLILGIAVMGALVSIMMFILLKDPPEQNAKTQGWTGFANFANSIGTSIKIVVSVRASWVNALIAGATFGAMFALGVVWGPRIMMAGGMEATTAYTTSSLCWLGLATGSPAISWLSERIGKMVLPMTIASLAQAVVLIVLLFVGSNVDTITASLLFYFFGFFAGGSMLPYAIAAKLVPSGLVGTSAAIVNATQFIVSGILMALPGQILAGASNVVGPESMPQDPSYGDYQTALIILPVALIAAFLLSLFLSDPYKKEEYA